MQKNVLMLVDVFMYVLSVCKNVCVYVYNPQFQLNISSSTSRPRQERKGGGGGDSGGCWENARDAIYDVFVLKD